MSICIFYQFRYYLFGKQHRKKMCVSVSKRDREQTNQNIFIYLYRMWCGLWMVLLVFHQSYCCFFYLAVVCYLISCVYAICHMECSILVEIYLSNINNSYICFYEIVKVIFFFIENFFLCLLQSTTCILFYCLNDYYLYTAIFYFCCSTSSSFLHKLVRK